MSDSEGLADRLERSQNSYIAMMADGQRSIRVRSKDDELAECYRLMRAAAAVVRSHDALLAAVGNPEALLDWIDALEANAGNHCTVMSVGAQLDLVAVFRRIADAVEAAGTPGVER